MQSLKGRFDRLKDKFDKISTPKTTSGNASDLSSKFMQKIDQISFPKFSSKPRNDEVGHVHVATANQQNALTGAHRDPASEVASVATQQSSPTPSKALPASSSPPRRSSVSAFFGGEPHTRVRTVSDSFPKVSEEPRCMCEKQAAHLTTQLRAVRANTIANCDALHRSDSAATSLLRVATDRSMTLQRTADELERFCTDVAQPAGELERFARLIAEIVSLSRFVETNLIELASLNYDLRVAQRHNEAAANFVRLKAERDALLSEEAAALRRTFEARRAAVADRVAEKQREFDERFRADVAQFLAEAQLRDSNGRQNSASYQIDAADYQQILEADSERRRLDFAEVSSGVDLSSVELPKAEDELHELEHFLADAVTDELKLAEIVTRNSDS